ncbi:MAG: Aspartyl/glutamyl-tRNA(Asn/Gln) amidotransferase subunit C [Parcubacteria group bacterium GW2011_GWA2_46_7]|nr:MAG: Aspartyl/glutamyl-tRNA(Asn/Gln) amidotransferase subunit C [Parcubacteria group bacterium GW2011_GWF1_45_5]KKU44039.1 MAG: Aspartyl/glutamyl-tRNA(Asn/Gln) amidotransferase subunit C [Parcubacteria group bacterium GW2011_GWA2_46_7]KKU47099.1 MAG: Aspartyl/glutamyl-tRNA(Asn/Gln) amidotransferase subunit C [Parcubacteria group bacterium GW2011_GWF2_46_8]
MADIISKETVEHVARLARLNLTPEQVAKIQPQLFTVLEYMSKIQKLETDGIPETAQVTGLENVLREDMVEEKRMLSQGQALCNARKVHDGFFVVDAVLKEF